MKTLDNFLNYITNNGEHITENIFQFTAIISGVLIYAYKKTKKILWVDIFISFIFCLVGWNTVKLLIPEDYPSLFVLTAWLFGVFSNKIVEFVLNMTIAIGKKAEIYANKKLDEYIKNDDN